MIVLETPSSPRALYMARGEDVDSYRPLFTGDVIDLKGSLAIVLQHPCAMRRGDRLAEKLLVAPVGKRQALRTRWADESPRVMPLPDLLGDGDDYAADFTDLDVLMSKDAIGAPRVVTLSEIGVNLLLQRWVYHNSRVTVPTITYQEQIAGPLAEAELEAEWAADLADTGNAEGFHSWIRSKSEEGGKCRQDMLDEAQTRPAVRREMRAEIRRRSGG